MGTSEASSSRRSSINGNLSQDSLDVPLSPSPSPSPSRSSGGLSAGSSTVSLNDEDDENVTITSPHRFAVLKGKQKSQEDLQQLAVSSRITELSYGISDIQTRIFEIQELRHQSQSSGDISSSTSIIDQALMNLDERVEAVSQGVQAVSQALSSERTPTQSQTDTGLADSVEQSALARKHTALVSEWEAVQSEIDVLREELKEDKWLTVFRTATEQAEGMMTSLEKAVNRCQNFVWQVHRQGPDDVMSQSSHTSSLNFETFSRLQEAFEAKKKHYVPATTKVLSIIDKGVQDRVTKNGECLRRHAECTQRWRNLRERIARTETDMDNVRKMLLSSDMAPSESGSSNASKSGFLATPPDLPSKHRAPSVASTLSRSVSPIRRFAKKITGGRRTPAPAPALLKTPSQAPKLGSRVPSSEPVPTLRKKRSSLFPFMGSQPPSPMSPATPDRSNHRYSQSVTPESSPSGRKSSLALQSRPAWNSSTKVESDEKVPTIRPKRISSAGPGLYSADANGVSPYKRSLSRSSMASSRPWSPVTSSISTAASSNPSIPPLFRPPSRSQTPGLPRSRPKTPSYIPVPKTPSHIPVPVNRIHLRSQSEVGWHNDSDESPRSLMRRGLSPGVSTSTSISSLSYSERSETPNGTDSQIPPPRPPSRSMIPVPSLSFSSPSRPGSTMSNYRPESSMSFRASAMRAQTPESALRQRAQQIPFYQAPRASASTPRPSALAKMPPSSFRDGTSLRGAPARPGSRAGAATPSLDGNPVHVYVPANPKDPLDAEVAAVVNSIPHGLLVERVDPPLRTIPKEGEEVRAQYAFSNSLARKVINCRLTVTTRNGVPNKRVMCRVGGGWQDLQLYMLNRQAGM
ncbi:hypothetical protein GLOTRDRAFT_59376 [Gloeophyllum trabeum ATCC 11539]|uniref:GAR domain-containing protein n=1 Tax=Gloeophyllum trabeum (strain ATCC 11539 / FP-39264 / Madison 617) TaxID=670483 RepID=S7Q8C1_GLOTA|nr:uncharacterized protein GLOTRDRAFT_59376 [Gloeophyllum trabeum ATCC 11539]EPQ56231.1 hypothetical protein GLOTRDRAFT_59376 [Gloeophyllum trabeum ATCC 11539]